MEYIKTMKFKGFLIVLGLLALTQPVLAAELTRANNVWRPNPVLSQTPFTSAMSSVTVSSNTNANGQIWQSSADGEGDPRINLIRARTNASDYLRSSYGGRGSLSVNGYSVTYYTPYSYRTY